MALDRLPPDRQLAKRLARDARAAARAQQRAELAHAKAVRRREVRATRARQVLPSQLLVATAAGVASVPADGAGGLLALVVAGVFGLRAYGSVRDLRRPPVPPPALLPARPPVAPPPHPSSVAFPAVRRLEAVREQLRHLLPLVAPAGRSAAEEAWAAAAEADAALRWQAVRLAAVEPHRGSDEALLRTLHEGVAAQERLVGAVADLVSASADPLATGRLQDATDALHGLAQGLRELR